MKTGEKIYFYSELTNDLIIEIEKFDNTFVYWSYDSCKQDIILLQDVGFYGQHELSITDAIDLIIKLKKHPDFYYYPSEL